MVAFYRLHRLGLVRFAVLLVGDQETAEDVVQDVFTRLHSKWRPGVTMIAYVRTCVLIGSRSILRRRAVALRRVNWSRVWLTRRSLRWRASDLRTSSRPGRTSVASTRTILNS
ncbi:sigma factor [Streptosporangium canum]|uniref:sigma factor n=1 Tax=Streptosporangium canum TaxID=324952 RepID=UPI00369087A4